VITTSEDAPRAVHLGVPFAGKTIKQIADHYVELIRQLDAKPAVIGHSFGGLLTQMIAGRGLAAVSVAISPAPFRGVLPVPIAALKSSWPGLRNRPTATVRSH
jgi:non-heme chloroperoxidase